jgi:CheY-like chemotaxis protein
MIREVRHDLDLTAGDLTEARAIAAVAAAADYRPQIGLLDIAMPGLDRHELARRLLQMPTRADLRLAAVTAYSQPSERQAAVRSGFEQYFVKPLDVSALQDWLEQASLSAAV